MRIATYEDILVNTDQDISYKSEDRVIGLILKNQAGGTVKHGMNTKNPVKQLLAGEEFPYGDIPGHYITGNLRITEFGATSNVVITIVRDRTPQENGEDC